MNIPASRPLLQVVMPIFLLFKNYRAVLPAVLVGLLAIGCAGIESTTAYYLPATTDVFPPKPKDAQIPILTEKPNRKSRTIGRFEWETTRNWKFIRRSLEFNARVNGADAVVVKKNKRFREVVLTDIPPSMEMVPFTRYVYVPQSRGKNRNYDVVPIVDFWPVFQPGYVSQSVRIWTTVNAEMIVFDK